jgi:hypothetical protein
LSVEEPGELFDEAAESSAVQLTENLSEHRTNVRSDLPVKRSRWVAFTANLSDPN